MLQAALIGGGAAVLLAFGIFWFAWKYLLYHPTPEEQERIDEFYRRVADYYR
jgi:hypothetical protein